MDVKNLAIVLAPNLLRKPLDPTRRHSMFAVIIYYNILYNFLNVNVNWKLNIYNIEQRMEQTIGVIASMIRGCQEVFKPFTEVRYIDRKKSNQIKIKNQIKSNQIKIKKSTENLFHFFKFY